MPVAGSHVWVWAGEARRFGNPNHAVTGPDGEFELVDPPLGRVTVVAEGASHLAVREESVAVRAGATTELNLRCRRGSTVTVRVFTPEQRGLAAATVALSRIVGTETVRHWTGRTDLDGCVDIRALPAADYVLEAWHVDWAPADRLQVRIEPGHPVRYSLTMAWGVRVVVCALDAEGRPLEGAWLTLTRHGAASPVWRGKTAVDGRTAPVRAAPGVYVARFEPCVRETEVTLSLGPDREITLIRAPSVRLSGVVRDRHGPLPGAMVSAVREGARPVSLVAPTRIAVASRRDQVVTGDDGTFTIPGLLAGRYAVLVTRRGSTVPAMYRLTIPEDITAHDIDLRLREGRLRVRVADSGSGRRRAGALVELRPSAGIATVAIPLRSNADGVVDLSRVPACNYEVSVRGPAGVDTKQVVVRPFEPAEVDLAWRES